jgi:hypothetical protein
MRRRVGVRVDYVVKIQSLFGAGFFVFPFRMNVELPALLTGRK